MWLGIETSCDDTSVSIVEDGKKIIANHIASQVDLHEKFGGVVPELASRKHLEAINPLLDFALKESGIAWSDVNGVAVSHGPGLVGSLLIGVASAKVIAGLLDVPLLGINHLEGHIYANFLEFPDILLPCLSLLVSGGHTALIQMEAHARFRLLGETRDDAAGECFDKVARILGLGYPGGPLIDRLAKEGDSKAISFPRAYLSPDSLDFSFSGLKTAVMYFTKEEKGFTLPDICASFQEAVVDVLVRKSLITIEKTGIRRLLLAGGVACNSRLREALCEASKNSGFELYYPPPDLCTDNAAMLACAASYYHQAGIRQTLEIDVHPNLQVGIRDD